MTRRRLFSIAASVPLLVVSTHLVGVTFARRLQEVETLFLAGIYDTKNYDWSPDIFEYTVQQINNGAFDHIAPGYGETLRLALDYALVNSNCDETTAVREYWNIRTARQDVPPDGVIGARCSGASTSLARITGLESVPHLSPASNSAQLSSVSEFPYFSRMVAPNDERGEVGALVALLRSFGWERVTILATDTQFSKDLVNEFRKVWAGVNSPSDPFIGSVGYSDTIRLNAEGAVDRESVKQVLNGIPTNEPSVNSRIILLVAHSQHAFKILQTAHAIKFQPDTVWVGPSSWAGRSDPTVDLTPWFKSSNNPGYLGLAPYQNRNQVYSAFMTRFQDWQRSQQKPVLTDLPAFAAETVDAIVAMAMALAQTPVQSLETRERDGATVVSQLRKLRFEGVSGFVEFTEEGDRKNPNYSILNAQSPITGGHVAWTDVGTVAPEVDSAIVEYASTCFAETGCGIDNIPDDTYPEKKVKLPWWVGFVLAVLSLLFIAVAFKYWRSHRSKSKIKAELLAFQDSIVGLRAVECDYIPNVTGIAADDDGSAMEQAATKLIAIPPPVVRWCWKETDSQMYQHDTSKVYGDPTDCWILYNDEQTRLLEAAYIRKEKECSPLSGYVVSMEKMVQMKLSTSYQREVSRIVENEKAGTPSFSTNLALGDPVPSELKEEPQMVLLEGDLVQISKQRKDGWAFGTKLHHADEEAVRLLVKAATDQADSTDEDEANIFPDTGWFPLTTTETPSAEQLQLLKKKVDSGALDPPANWAPTQNKSVAERHVLSEGTPERDSVVKSFLSTLQGRNVEVLKVERIQNLAMFQSYIVKRQTICFRETEGQDTTDPAIQQKALQRFERRWLWHGTNSDVVDKILNQGFNRSFCGKNATAYGKGVYFARDALYSSHRLYSVPDKKGNQYMMACSVCVGEFCLGKHDALTPDVRDAKSHSLYDSTVNAMPNPSIYVTYHDAQAYPEYLITFRQP